MTAHEGTRNRIAQQIALCDNVLKRLTDLEGNGDLVDLIGDVKALRVSLQQTLVSMDGDGSHPSS